MTRRFLPGLERPEARLLLSVTPILALHRPALPRVHAEQAAGTTAGGSGDSGGPSSSSNQYLNPTGTPSKFEKARKAFYFSFAGAFVQGGGRYSDEASQVRIKAVGTSTYFLHGDLQLGAVVPTDPSRPTSGLAEAYDRNNNANSAFGFDLTGSTADLDRAGRPTKFTGTTDLNTSAGIFVESQSQATVEIRYIPDGRRHADGTVQGKAVVVIKGSAYTLGVTNNLGGPIARRNRLDPNSVRV
jgi:hypothetical protein